MKYWINQKGSDKLIVITDDVIYNHHPSEKKLFEFEQQLRQQIIPERLTGTPFHYIKTIEANNQSSKLKIAYGAESELEIDAGENKSDIIAHLKTDATNHPQFSEYQQSIFKKILKPLLGIAVIGVSTYYLYDMAYYMELGYTYEVVGGRAKGQGFGNMLIGVAEMLGKSGVIGVGAFLVFLVVAFNWKKITREVVITKLKYR